ncbi:MAG: AmmeMemoRadiSam system protein A, partial [Gemmatimonadales bacterium]
GRPLPAPPAAGAAARRRGAFVTLMAGGTLRGCIGHLAADRPLGDIVRDMTVAAARDDPRFPPVSADELAGVRVEISALTPPAPLVPVDVTRIVVGRDGLVVRRGSAQGVLLPQVAPEYHWGPDAFLAATCRKAGLAPEVWAEPGTEVFTFQAEVFGE